MRTWSDLNSGGAIIRASGGCFSLLALTFASNVGLRQNSTGQSEEKIKVKMLKEKKGFFFSLSKVNLDRVYMLWEWDSSFLLVGFGAGTAFSLFYLLGFRFRQETPTISLKS